MMTDQEKLIEQPANEDLTDSSESDSLAEYCQMPVKVNLRNSLIKNRGCKRRLGIKCN